MWDIAHLTWIQNNLRSHGSLSSAHGADVSRIFRELDASIASLSAELDVSSKKLEWAVTQALMKDRVRCCDSCCGADDLWWLHSFPPCTDAQL